ncbi:MAG TPA: sulfite exporter TauE/SafE family protein [Chitinophagales bacterium]|nr:sulfite exporter TauE/SafE family protein [Chitinophagales bacterium]
MLPVIAFLYASVGHGGASGYLALMGLFGVNPSFMRPTALLLNVFVSVGAFEQYARRGFMRGHWTLFCWLCAGSIPAAYLGGKLGLPISSYKVVLGIFLLFPTAWLMGLQRYIQKLEANRAQDTAKKVPYNWALALIMGLVIGFLSGLIGIGGGIILSPILIWLQWTTVKETAPISALFIFCNSISGLFGVEKIIVMPLPEMTLVVGLALGGGLLGAYLGAKHFNQPTLKWLLAIVLLIAAVKLIFSA